MSKASSMKTLGPSSPDPFRAEDDANTLNRAAVIIGDKSRHAAARIHIKKQLKGHGLMGTVPVPSAAPGFASPTGKAGGVSRDRSKGHGESASMAGTKPQGAKRGATSTTQDVIGPSSAGSQRNAGAKARTSQRGTKAGGGVGPGFGANDAAYRFGKKR